MSLSSFPWRHYPSLHFSLLFLKRNSLNVRASFNTNLVSVKIIERFKSCICFLPIGTFLPDREKWLKACTLCVKDFTFFKLQGRKRNRNSLCRRRGGPALVRSSQQWLERPRSGRREEEENLKDIIIRFSETPHSLHERQKFFFKKTSFTLRDAKNHASKISEHSSTRQWKNNNYNNLQKRCCDPFFS